MFCVGLPWVGVRCRRVGFALSGLLRFPVFSLWVFVGVGLLMFGGDALLVLVVDLGFCLVRVALLCV